MVTLAVTSMCQMKTAPTCSARLWRLLCSLLRNEQQKNKRKKEIIPDTPQILGQGKSFVKIKSTKTSSSEKWQATGCLAGWKCHIYFRCTNLLQVSTGASRLIFPTKLELSQHLIIRHQGAVLGAVRGIYCTTDSVTQIHKESLWKEVPRCPHIYFYIQPVNTLK